MEGTVRQLKVPITCPNRPVFKGCMNKSDADLSAVQPLLKGKLHPDAIWSLHCLPSPTGFTPEFHAFSSELPKVEACYNHIWFSLQLCFTTLNKRMKTKSQWKPKPQVELTFKILSWILPAHHSCAIQQKSLALFIVMVWGFKAGLHFKWSAWDKQEIIYYLSEQKNSKQHNQIKSSQLKKINNNNNNKAVLVPKQKTRNLKKCHF